MTPLAKRIACGLLVVATACTGTAAERGLAAANEAEVTVRSLMAARESDDARLIEDLFWPQATYDDFPNQHTYQGIAEIVEYVNTTHAWADDVFLNVVQIHITQSGAVAEWVFSATQARPVGTMIPTATGLEVVMNGVTIIEMQDGRIIRAADYADITPMLLQLGSRIELPGGGTLEPYDRRE